ncbi:MBL fold metallo-hydrolase [Staphylospora marina]|uniref:MBL fold metallo-hydrolase n=1 Tax=Staphylospora marina TaxID=2490858 RepID=UPI000F5BC6B9|nr:MBL fold metallo-hydrolase [Staphylospora marina]
MEIAWIIGVLLILMLVLPLAGMWFRFRRAPRPQKKEPDLMLDPASWNDDEVTIGWVGHSTVLINMYGVKILTDPVLGPKVGVHLGIGDWQIGPARHTEPAVSLDALGQVDLILLSHAHMDHFDLPTLKKLARPETTVITARGTSRLLRKLRFGKVMELGGEDRVDLPDGLRVTAVPVRHWGNRFPWNRDYEYTGYLIEKKGTRLFFPGDTAWTPDFVKLRKHGPIDLAFMPIGAYSPDSFQANHCTPEQAWSMFLDTGAKWLVPIHWDTFVLSFEPVDEPLKRLLRAAGDETHRIVIRKHGEQVRLVGEHATATGRR